MCSSVRGREQQVLTREKLREQPPKEGHSESPERQENAPAGTESAETKLAWMHGQRETGTSPAGRNGDASRQVVSASTTITTAPAVSTTARQGLSVCLFGGKKCTNGEWLMDGPYGYGSQVSKTMG